MAGSRWKTALAWLPRILVAAVFVGAGTAKLTAQPMMIQNFDVIGLGQGFRIVTGVIEWAAAALILWPRTMVFGAALMLCVLVGAFVAQLGPLHGDVVHVIVLAAVVALALWARRWANSAARSSRRTSSYIKSR